MLLAPSSCSIGRGAALSASWPPRSQSRQLTRCRRQASSAPAWAHAARPYVMQRLLTDGGASFQCTVAQNRSFSRGLNARSKDLQAPAHEAASVSEALRDVMRSSAQPVAIVTTYLAVEEGDAQTAPAPTSTLVHGATLSSFTSVSLDPAMVTFSLRTPSRLADALVAASRGRNGGKQAHFVISILSESQETIAKAFATPGLDPYDTTGTRDASGEAAHPLDLHDTSPSHFSGGVPYLSDALAALACRLVGILDLRTADPSEIRWHPSSGPLPSLRAKDAQSGGSVLLLAQVCGIEKALAAAGAQTASEARPLLYWQRKFSKVQA